MRARTSSALRLMPLAALLALCSCTDALLQPEVATDKMLDDRLSLRGEVCTARPNASAFPVKVIFLVDSSGSMCVSDGPGSQEGSGFCETIGAQLAAMGVTTPGRVRALHSVIDRFRQQIAQEGANVSVALVPFDSMIRNPFPPLTETGPVFVPADNGELPTRINDLQNTLGKGTDYQGALAHAYQRIDADVQRAVASGKKGTLPRTKYVVVLITDGTPYPRCTSNDADPDPSVYATADAPWGIWRDNPSTFCNPLPDGSDPNAGDDGQNSVINGFVIGTDRNQNYQLFDPIDRLMTLKDKYSIGDLRLHTVFVFNTDAVDLCGQICLTDLYNGMPSAEDAHRVGAWTLTEMAVKHGDGTYQEFLHQADIQLGSLDYTSLASRFVQKTLMASNTFAWPDSAGPSVDSDGDGLVDTLESADDSGSGFAVKATNHFSTDSDGDGFPDAFEAAHRGQGFDPLAVDPRGCLDHPQGLFRAKYSCADTDGDLLSEAMERYLGSETFLPDTDADGILDGVEVLLGLDPVVPNTRLDDRDLDGVPDVLEVFQHTNPLLDDRLVHVRDGYRYQMTEKPQADGSVCYDFLVSNIRLLSPDSESGQHGYNYITLTFGEAPEGGVTRDFGAWKQACVFAQFAPPSLRVPAGPEIVLENSDFHVLGNTDGLKQPNGLKWASGYRNLCTKGAPPP